MSSTFYKIRKGLGFPGNTSHPTDPTAGDLHYRSDLNLLFFYAGGSWQQLTLGAPASGGIQKVTLFNSTVTTLPTGTNFTTDGVAVSNGDSVLFTALSSSNNQIYTVSGVGSAIAWTAQTIFAGVATPTNGDLVYVKSGTGYAKQIQFFDGSAWSLLSVDYKVFTAGEAISAGAFAYVSVGNANGDTGNTAGFAYNYSPFNIFKCQIVGVVKNAVTSGQQALVQTSGVCTFPATIAATTDLGKSAWALTSSTISTANTSIQRANTTPTAHVWGLCESSVGTVLNTTQIELDIQNNFISTYTAVSPATTNTVANIDTITNLPNISSMSDGLYATLEYSVRMVNSGAATVVQTGLINAWKTDGTNWDYSHNFNVSVADLGFRISVTSAGVIQYIAPTATITSITNLKIHSVNNRG
jgi:hypothetical protein